MEALQAQSSTIGYVQLFQLSEPQKQLYRNVLCKNIQWWKAQHLPPHLLNSLLPTLQKVCTHPTLLPKTESEEEEFKDIISASGKLRALLELLQSEERSRCVIVASSSNEMLDLMGDVFDHKEIAFTRLKKKSELSTAIAELTQDNEKRVFLCSIAFLASFPLERLPANESQLIVHDLSFSAASPLLKSHLNFLLKNAQQKKPPLKVLFYCFHSSIEQSILDRITKQHQVYLTEINTGKQYVEDLFNADDVFSKVMFSSNSEPQIDVNDADFWNKVLPPS